MLLCLRILGVALKCLEFFCTMLCAQMSRLYFIKTELVRWPSGKLALSSLLSDLQKGAEGWGESGFLIGKF